VLVVLLAANGCEKKREGGAVDVVRGYVGDLRAGLPLSAYERTSLDYRAAIAPEDFARFAADIVYLQESAEFRPEKVERVGDGYHIEGVLVTGGGEVPVTADVASYRGKLYLDQFSAPGERLMPLARGRPDPADGSGSR
jgi:hypothetical protein